MVSDSYPNYKVVGDQDLDIYMNQGTYTLYGQDKSGKQFPVDPAVQSMRILSDGAPEGEPYYIIPEYVYVRYHLNTTANTEQYAIFHFVEDGGRYKVYVDKGTIDNIDRATDDGFNAAVTRVNGRTGVEGLMSDKVKDVYFSADSVANTVFVDMQFENAKYIDQTYDYRDAISLRNTYALTVPPSKMFLRETVSP